MEQVRLGWIEETADYLIFFGNRSLTRSQLQDTEIQKELRLKSSPLFLKQIHGDNIVNQEQPLDLLTEADGHWTKSPETPLGIVTADCIPVLLYHPKLVLALHVGWRGLANDIILKSIDLLSLQVPPFEWKVWVGPSLQQENFEVDQDVADILFSIYKSAGGNDHHTVFKNKGLKTHIDNQAIAQQQLLSKGIGLKNQYRFQKCTLKSPDLFHSYRRDKEIAGRQYSWILKK